MFGSEIIDFALSFCFLFFLLSIIASTLLEAANSRNTKRAVDLQNHIKDFAGDKITAAIYANPIVCGLTTDDALPAYISSDIFATALLAEYKSAAANPIRNPLTPADVANKKAFDRVDALVTTLALTDATDSDKIQAIAKWFDSAMARLSGRYKRDSQYRLFAIGLATALIWNANVLLMCEQLWASSMARSVATAAVTVVAPTANSKSPLQDDDPAKTAATKVLNAAANLNLPIGWKFSPSASDLSQTGSNSSGAASTDKPPITDKSNPNPTSNLFMGSLDELWDFKNPFTWLVKMVLSAVGWLLTAFLISLGAPFWFDILSRISNLRGNGVKPPDTTQPQK